MNIEDNFDSISEDTTHCSRMDPEDVSLYDINSRDSGYEDPLESLGNDAFLEEFLEFNVTENSNLPTDFSNLLEKPIVTVTIIKKPTCRSALSLEEGNPLKKKIYQRSEYEEFSDFAIKKKKLASRPRTEENDNAVVPFKSKPVPCSSQEVIKTAIQRSYSEPDLVADFSRSYSLPLATSCHQDLRSIDGNTLKRLLSGEFSDVVTSFKVVDCRYPYEYNGGHIIGAVNLYTREQCSALLDENLSGETSSKPKILIFHCEFSAERGPNLYRHVRKEDRTRNANTYPYLCYPEMYILEGGYKKFFEENFDLCTPGAYTQMLDPKHKDDFKCFRQKSKTWDSDARSSSKRTNKFRNVKKCAL